MFLLIVLFGLLEMRLYYIQIHRHLSYSKIAEDQFEYDRKINYRRGNIYDCKGRELAVSYSAYSLFATPGDIQLPEMTARKIYRLIGMPYLQILEKIKKRSSFVWLKKGIDFNISKRIRALKLNGIHLVREERRYYPEGCLASQVLGIVGDDNQGLSGIEYLFDQVLSGGKENITWIQDSMGRKIIRKGSHRGFPLQGNNIFLTIDKVLQFIAQEELQSVYEKYDPINATIIIQEPDTGKILALANCPSYDANKRINYKFLKNQAISDIFEPGSTFKLVVACGALEEKIMNPNQRIYVEKGVYRVNGRPAIHDHEKLGFATFQEIIEESSNIGIAKMGERLGKFKVYQYARNLGFGNQTGIKLPGETGGILRRPDKWTPTSLGRVSFGQEVGVTAIQLINAYSAIANGGTLMEPMIVDRITTCEGKVIKRFKTYKVRRVVSANVACTMTNILKGAVEKGTGTRAKIEGYMVAGKTGTAQKFDKNEGRYSNKNYVASFVGYLPTDNPKLTILVVMDEPKKEFWGGSVAAPVFANVAEKAMQYLGIPEEDERERFQDVLAFKRKK